MATMPPSPFVALVLQSLGMMVGTFLCGVIPLYLSLSKTKLRILEVMGAGLLVGASMTVVLPEGVFALFNGANGRSLLGHDHSVEQHALPAMSHVAQRRASSFRRREFDPETTTGIALLAGFLVMFLIDQIASPGAHMHTSGTGGQEREAHSHWHGPSHRPEAMRLMRASSLAISKSDGGVEDQENTPSQIGRHFATASSSREESPERMPADHDNHFSASHIHQHRVPSSAGTSSHRSATGNGIETARKNGENGDVPSGMAQSRGVRRAFASIAGLMIHAAADGIAMGASAGSNDDSLKLVVLLAIMIHKAPAAFGLCTLLMGQRLHKSQIRRAVALFSMSTPCGALLTYLFLSVVLRSPAGGDDNGISAQHIGGALTFSAGTFLFVAMHAVQELTSAAADIDLDSTHHRHHHSSDGGAASSVHEGHDGAPPKLILGRTGRVSCFILGAILPKIMQALTGHHH